MNASSTRPGLPTLRLGVMTTLLVVSILPSVATADGPPRPRLLNAPPVQVTFTGASQPSISPSGVLCAVQGGIRLFDAAGSPQAVLADGTWPTWSPAGDKIGFESGGIGTVVVATSQVASVCPGTCNVNNGLAWSPLGDEFVYHDPDDGLVLASYPGGATSIVPCGGCAGEGPAWSPDGQWIAFEDGLEIMKVARAGGTPDTVFAGAGGGGDPGHPAWSPDGRWIAFQKDDYDASIPAVVSHIWIVDARGASFGLYQLTTDNIDDLSPAWGADSRTVFFTRRTNNQIDVWRIAFDAALPAERTSWGRIKVIWR